MRGSKRLSYLEDYITAEEDEPGILFPEVSDIANVDAYSMDPRCMRPALRLASKKGYFNLVNLLRGCHVRITLELITGTTGTLGHTAIHDVCRAPYGTGDPMAPYGPPCLESVLRLLPLPAKNYMTGANTKDNVRSQCTNDMLLRSTTSTGLGCIRGQCFTGSGFYVPNVYY